MAVYGGSLGESNGVVRALGSNVRVWLASEVQPPENDVRLYLSFRHSGQGCEGLKVTHSCHSPRI
jgi:hypothetical protein